MRSGEEAFCIDSPVLPDELELLPAIAQQADFRVVGCLATHVDWDHVLGRYAFADAPLGVAESSAARLRNEPGAAQRELRDFDEEHYVERPAPLTIPSPQALPVPGHCGIGERELELHPTEGHTLDGMAIRIPWAEVLVVGDYVSPVEIPWISESGSASAYLATLDAARAARRGAPRTSCPATARRSRASARWRSCARTARTWRRCWSRGRTRRCRWRAGPARRRRSTPRT